MNRSGFTLLEVMVAIAILAIALTALLGNQGQSMMAADESDFSVVSAFLAKRKMAEIVGRGTDLIDTTGDFGEHHPNYFWSVEVEDADFSESEMLQGTESLLKRIDLIVHTEDERRSFTVSRYVLATENR